MRSSARCTRPTTSRGRSRQIDLAANGMRFDVVHDHCGFTALAMADRIDTPLVHTLHGQFTASTAAFYARHGHKAALVGISRAQLASAPPGLAADRRDPEPDRRAGLAAAGAQGRLPAVDREDDRRRRDRTARSPPPAPRTCRSSWRASSSPGSRRSSTARSPRTSTASASASSARSAGRAKRSLFARARGLLMPIRWEEPFGMVMVEALACGTPVIAFPEGAARELVHRRADRVPRRRRAGDGRRDRPSCRASPRGLPRLGRRALRRRRRRRRLRAHLPVGGAPARRNPSRVSERTLSVLDGSTFVVGDRLGDVRADEGREHGFFSRGHALHLALGPARGRGAAGAARASTRARTSTLSSS